MQMFKELAKLKKKLIIFIIKIKNFQKKIFLSYLSMSPKSRVFWFFLTLSMPKRSFISSTNKLTQPFNSFLSDAFPSSILKPQNPKGNKYTSCKHGPYQAIIVVDIIQFKYQALSGASSQQLVLPASRCNSDLLFR